MAAKKKGDSSDENEKKKASPTTNPKKATAPRKKAVPKKKPVAKKETKAPTPVVVPDDDFGLEEVELKPIETAAVEPMVEPAVEKKPKSTFVPASQRPIKKKKNKKTIIILSVIIVLALAAFYFLVFVPRNEEPESVPVKVVVEPEPVEEPTPEPEPVQVEVDVEAEPTPVPEPLSVITISESGGRFYVVVGSFFDVDFAEDRANDLIAAGIQSYILQPQEGKLYHRVGIKQANDLAEANSGIEELKQTFGNEIWVLKY